MDRQIIYPGQVPMETDLLLTNKNTMTAIAKLCAAIFGVASCVSGFATSQTVVPSLAVLVGPGDIYSLQNIDGTAYSSLPADTSHSIVKQGISLDPVTLPITPPATAGFSINYLIQVGYQDSDTGSAVLPYYNASNPSIAYSGPANSGAAQPTKRAGIVSIQAKAGTAATTGTQTTPAPDAGYTGLYVVTVANGASTVVNANISALATAPFINNTLHGLLPTFTTPVVVGPGTASNHAINLSQFSGTRTPSGYQRLPGVVSPGGLILQWGLYSNPGGIQNAGIVLPLAFPTAILIAQLTTFNATTSANGGSVYSLGPTGFNAALNGAYSFYWFALGY
jgi:hypothetical protein